MEATGNKKTGKREAIVEAAIRVFSRKGYHNTRMEEIALEAGAGKGTIYEYFDSKLELFQEILFKGWRVFQENTTVEEIDSMPIHELLQGIISGHLRFFKEHRQLTRVTFWDVEAIDQELMAWARRVRADKEERVQLLIEAAIARGEVRADLDAGVISRLVCAIIPYFATYAVMNDEDLDPQIISNQITSAILDGIRQ